jgi:hypothetical protein
MKIDSYIANRIFELEQACFNVNIDVYISVLIQSIDAELEGDAKRREV